MMYEHFDGESGRPTVRMSLNTALSCSGQGRQDDNVRAAMLRVEWVADDATIRKSLRGYGAWEDDELGDTEANRSRMLWIAACDIRENPDMYRA